MPVIALGILGILALVMFKGSIETGTAAVVGNPSFDRWDHLFRAYGNQFEVPWRWLKAICMIESSLGEASSVKYGLKNPTDEKNSVSSDGLSWGLMQVTLKTGRAFEGMVVTPAYLNDPVNSIRIAAKLFAENIKRFGIEDRESIIRAYNGGPKFGAATLPYWAKFLVNIKIVLMKNPGDELEGYN